MSYWVRAIIERLISKILLALEETRKETGQWTLPGGLAEDGETPVTAINRLLKNLFPDIQYIETPTIFYRPTRLAGCELETVLVVQIKEKVVLSGKGIIAELQWVKIADALNGSREYNLSNTLQQTLIRFQRKRGERPPEFLG